MQYVKKRVRDWKNTSQTRELNTFQLDNSDYHKYSNRLFGFSHGTNQNGLEAIIASGKIISSFNLRQAQTSIGKRTTGGDRGHDGQYTVYFRYVEKRTKKTDKAIPEAIVRSLGGVGGGSGYVLFVSLSKIVDSQTCFALAGGVDGIKGTNCFTTNKITQSRTSFNERKQRYLQSQQAGGNRRYPPISEEEAQFYQGDYSPVYLGKTQFELGLSAAEANTRGNEIGFFNEIPLDIVEVIMIRSRGFETIRGYSLAGTFSRRGKREEWRVFLRNGSGLDLGLEPPLPQMTVNSQIVRRPQNRTANVTRQGANLRPSRPRNIAHDPRLTIPVLGQNGRGRLGRFLPNRRR